MGSDSLSLIYTFLSVEIRNSSLPLPGFLYFTFPFQGLGLIWGVLFHVTDPASLCSF